MGKKRRKKTLTRKEKAELVIQILTAIGSIITAVATLLKD